MLEPWNYRVIEIKGEKLDKIEQALIELGHQGWELVSCVEQGGSMSGRTLLFFKQPAGINVVRAAWQTSHYQNVLI